MSWLPDAKPAFDPSYAPFVTPTVLVAGSLAYMLIVVGLQQFMKGKKAMTLLWPMRIYNLVQIILCSYMTYGLLPSFPNIFGINNEFTADTEYFVFIHYLSKFLDFFDTIFMILRHKEDQVSFLHLYHHATIGGIWGLLLHLGYGNGVATYGAWINSFVHVAMYTHYLLTSFQIENPFKRQVTQLQISQFYSCILHAVLAWLLDTHIPFPLPQLQVAYHLSLIVLFTRFYSRSYSPQSKARATLDKAKPQ